MIELILDVQFEPIAGLDVPRLGLLWQEFRANFPRVEQRALASPLVQQFGPADEIQVLIEPLGALPLPRLWFLDEQGSELIQVQHDRFIHNWRKTTDADEYPRYRSVRSKFREELDTFAAFLRREGLPEPTVDLCEITYLNHVQPGEGWERYGELDRVIRPWKLDFGSDALTGEAPEAVSLNFQFVIPDETGNSIGRWQVAVQPAVTRSDGRAVIVIRNTARGAPLGDGFDGALTFLDLGHEWAVRGFAALTTDEMHLIWGRKGGR